MNTALLNTPVELSCQALANKLPNLRCYRLQCSREQTSVEMNRLLRVLARLPYYVVSPMNISGKYYLAQNVLTTDAWC